MGCHFLLQGIFLTQGLNPSLLHLLHWLADCLLLNHPGSPIIQVSRDRVSSKSPRPPAELRKNAVLLRSYIACIRRKEKTVSFRSTRQFHHRGGLVSVGAHQGHREAAQMDTQNFMFQFPCPILKFYFTTSKQGRICQQQKRQAPLCQR